MWTVDQSPLSLSLRYFLSFRYSPALSEDRLVIEKSLTRMNRCVCVCVWGGGDEGRGGGGGGWLCSRQLNDQCLVCYHLPRLYRIGRISLFFSFFLFFLNQKHSIDPPRQRRVDSVRGSELFSAPPQGTKGCRPVTLGWTSVSITP